MDFNDIHDWLRHSATVRVPDSPQVSRAAVAMILRPNLDILFIQRAARSGDPWSGHMALPGGRREPQDDDLIATAIRETHEEVGLSIHNARLLGQLNDNVSPARNALHRLVISAYVFGIDERNPSLSLSSKEVAGTYWFNLERFLNAEGRTTMPYTWQNQQITLPAVYLDDAHIWGLTLRILDDVVEKIRAQSVRTPSKD